MPESASGIVARTVPSARRRSGVVKTSSVGMFATYARPSTVSSPAEHQSERGVRPMVRSVPSPLNLTASKRRSLSRAARSLRVSMCWRHAATGSGSSRRVAVATASHNRSTSGSPKTVLRPALVRVGDDRPVQRPFVQRGEVALRQLLRTRPADAGAVEVREQLGLRIAADLDDRAVLLGEVVHPRERPRCRPVERVLRCVGDPRVPGVLVGVLDVDEPRATLVRNPGDRAHEWRMLDERIDPEHLPLTDVRPHLDGEAGVFLEALLGGHDGQAYRPRC